MNRRVHFVILLLSFLLFLSGCHIDIMGITEETDGSVFRYGYTGAWPETRNPLLDADGVGQILYYHQLYEPLVDIGSDYEWRGRLAEDWSLAVDEVTWTFYLRKGVRWHDGEEFNADDVVATYRLVKSLGLAAAAQIAEIDTITRLDDYTVTIKTYAPIGDMLPLMLPILPGHLYGGAGSKDVLAAFNPSPIGTGPFRFAEEESGTFVRYEANDHYWAGRPAIDVLLFSVCTPEEGVSALLEGSLDYYALEAEQLLQIPTSSGLWQHVYETDSVVILGYQYGDSVAGKASLNDRQLRLALDQCFDVESIAKSAPGTVACRQSIIPGIAGDWSVDFTQTSGYRSFNPEAAISILDKANYLDQNEDGIREDRKGNPLSFTLLTTDDLAWVAHLLAKDAAQIGIVLEVTVQALPWDDAAVYDMSLYRRQGGITNPVSLLEDYTTLSESRYTGYAGEEYDTLVMRAAESPWQEDRLALVRQAQQVLYRDVPCTVLFHESQSEVCRRSSWQGWQTTFENGGSLWCRETMIRLAMKK